MEQAGWIAELLTDNLPIVGVIVVWLLVGIGWTIWAYLARDTYRTH